MRKLRAKSVTGEGKKTIGVLESREGTLAATGPVE